MTALAAGTRAPDFELNTTDGAQLSLSQELVQRPVVLAFFKVSCPTCQYAFPFLERLHTAYGGQKVGLYGISQNSVKETLAFTKEFGVTFPVLLDELDSYPVSNAFGLTNVPTVFWVAQDGEIEVSSVGWVRADFEEINRRIAGTEKLPPSGIFKPGEMVRDFRAG
jgi:peroxiredoxin